MTRFVREFLKIVSRIDAFFRFTAALTALACLFVAFTAAAQTVLGNPTPAPGAPGGPAWVTALFQYVVAPLIPVIGVLITTALAKLTQYLHQKGQTSKTAEAFAVATDFVATALAHVRAGIEADVKAALADGTIDAAERAALKQKVLDLVKAELPASVSSLLSGVLGPALQTWLSGRAEQAIDAVVAQAAPAATPVAVPS